MKGFRQILRVARIARKTNEWILEKAGVTRTLLVCITKLHYFGHIIRRTEKHITQGTLARKRKRGRPKTT